MKRHINSNERGNVAESKRPAKSVFGKYADTAKTVARYAALPVLLTLAGCAGKSTEVKSAKDTQKVAAVVVVKNGGYDSEQKKMEAKAVVTTTGNEKKIGSLVKEVTEKAGYTEEEVKEKMSEGSKAVDGKEDTGGWNIVDSKCEENFDNILMIWNEADKKCGDGSSCIASELAKINICEENIQSSKEYQEVMDCMGDEACDFRNYDESKKPECNSEAGCKSNDMFAEKTLTMNNWKFLSEIKILVENSNFSEIVLKAPNFEESKKVSEFADENGFPMLVSKEMKESVKNNSNVSVKKGDDLLKIGNWDGKINGVAELRVKDVDSKGIILEMYSWFSKEGPLPDIHSNEDPVKGYLRLNYDGTMETVSIFDGTKSDKNAADAKQLIMDVFGLASLEAKDGKLVIQFKGAEMGYSEMKKGITKKELKKNLIAPKAKADDHSELLDKKPESFEKKEQK